jgi:hypothetical protein
LERSVSPEVPGTLHDPVRFLNPLSNCVSTEFAPNGPGQFGTIIVMEHMTEKDVFKRFPSLGGLEKRLGKIGGTERIQLSKVPGGVVPVLGVCRNESPPQPRINNLQRIEAR